jgi:hypothetical protein
MVLPFALSFEVGVFAAASCEDSDDIAPGPITVVIRSLDCIFFVLKRFYRCQRYNIMLSVVSVCFVFAAVRGGSGGGGGGGGFRLTCL